MRVQIAATVLASLFLVTSAAAAENQYSATQIKIILSKKARDAKAQGCSNGQVWCCKKTMSGGTACQCTSFCS